MGETVDVLVVGKFSLHVDLSTILYSPENSWQLWVGKTFRRSINSRMRSL
jgi:hypothetical protein